MRDTIRRSANRYGRKKHCRHCGGTIAGPDYMLSAHENNCVLNPVNFPPPKPAKLEGTP